MCHRLLGEGLRLLRKRLRRSLAAVCAVDSKPLGVCLSPPGVLEWWSAADFFPQVANGLVTRKRCCDWYDSQRRATQRSGPATRVSHLTETLKRHGMPIVVESSGDELLDQTRKDNVVDAIQKLANAPIAPEAVVVSQQFPSGFGGEESRQVYFTLMQQVQNGGVTYQNGRSITGIGATPGGGSNTGQGTQSVLGNSNGR